jgi:uncharacterized protein
MTATGLDVRVRLTPRSSQDLIDGVIETATGAAVRAWVRAVPEGGRANSAVELLVAEWLGVPKTRVTVSTGISSRIKMLSIEGNGLELAKKLADWLSRLPPTTTSKP